MTSDSASVPEWPAARPFATTRWSMVRAAGTAGSPEARRALSELCQAYWPPLYAFLRRRGCSVEEAEDVVQGFFADLLERDDLQKLAPERGRFRAFLLASLKHFLSNERDRARTLKRGGGRALIPLDVGALESRSGLAGHQGGSPEAQFDREWALTLLERVREQLRHESAAAGREERFAHLAPFLTEPETRLADAAAALGMTVGAAKVSVHRLRQRFRELLRAEIAHTVDSAEEIDDEIRALFEALRR